jgi:hypothetical protein
VLTALFVATFPTAAGAAAPAPISLTVEPGFNGFYKGNRWLPVSVELQNSGPATEVTIEMQQQWVNTEALNRSTLSTQLPGASRRRYELSVLPVVFGSGGRLVTRVERRGAPAIRQESDLREIGQGEQLVLLINPEEGALSVPPAIRRAIRGPNQMAPIHVASMKPERAPERWIGYDPVDALVLGDVTEQSLSVPQQRAIGEWVATGGTLIVSGGADAARLRSRFFQELLPVEVLGTKTLNLSGAGLPDAVATVTRPRPGARTTPLQVSEALALGHAGDETPLVVMGRKGLGQVIFVALDVTRPPFRGSDAGAAVWRGILTSAQTGADLLDIVRQRHLDPSIAVYGVSPNLGEACFQLSQLQAPPSSGVALFLLAYIVCLVPVNYAVLRRRDRKEWAWVTTPAIVLAFTLFAYLFGYGMKGSQIRLARANVVETWSGEGLGTSFGYTGLFSPRKTRYEIAAEPPAILSPVGNEQGVKLVHEESVRLAEIPIDMWSMRLFRVEAPVSLGRGVSVRWEGAGDSRKAIVTNGTPYDLEECAYLGGRLPGMPYRSVGALRRGETRAIGPVKAGGVALDNLISLDRQGKGDLDRMKTSMLRAVSGNRMSLASPILVGWVRQPFFRMSVNGRQVREENLTLVVVHLAGGEAENG